MLSRELKTAVFELALLAALPLLADSALAERARRRDARDDELSTRFECQYAGRECVADFDGDGTPDSVRVEEDAAKYGVRWLVARVGGGEVLRIPFVNVDGTLRTHVAVREAGGQTRLLVYDGTSMPEKRTNAVLALRGGRLREVAAEPSDREILSAMAAHDDTGGWNVRVFRSLIRFFALFAYYCAFAVSASVWLFRNFNEQGGKPRYHFLRGGP